MISGHWVSRELFHINPMSASFYLLNTVEFCCSFLFFNSSLIIELPHEFKYCMGGFFFVIGVNFRQFSQVLRTCLTLVSQTYTHMHTNMCGYIRKIFEKFIFNRLTKCTEIANGLLKNQFRFRKERSMMNGIPQVIAQAEKLSKQKGRGNQQCKFDPELDALNYNEALYGFLSCPRVLMLSPPYTSITSHRSGLASATITARFTCAKVTKANELLVRIMQNTGDSCAWHLLVSVYSSTLRYGCKVWERSGTK